jgi:hypothetical protein
MGHDVSVRKECEIGRVVRDLRLGPVGGGADEIMEILGRS